MIKPKMVMVAVAAVGFVIVSWGIAARAFPPAEGTVRPGAPAGGRQGEGQGEHPLLAERTKGADGAPITIFEMGDLQCPACRDFWANTLTDLEREYIESGKARLIFLNFPLVSIHPNAAAAHEFAMCAAHQDTFWTVHDLLYQYQQRWAGLEDPVPFFWTLADSAGLDEARMKECVGNGSTRDLIRAETQLSYNSGLRSTPSFVIEGGVISGAAPIEIWRQVLDSIYVAKTTSETP